jgi:hypothetical protein
MIKEDWERQHLLEISYLHEDEEQFYRLLFNEADIITGENEYNAIQGASEARIIIERNMDNGANKGGEESIIISNISEGKSSFKWDDKETPINR